MALLAMCVYAHVRARKDRKGTDSQRKGGREAGRGGSESSWLLRMYVCAYLCACARASMHLCALRVRGCGMGLPRESGYGLTPQYLRGS